ncbi:MAG: hypothetical protein ED557_06100 [Balneola sp.]|nr:MAG: hypothetical protein ED557_06100 [Balneola sp.]
MRITPRILFVISSVLLIVSELSAQSSPNDFLLTAFEDPSLNEYQAQLNFLKTRNFRLPIGEEVEFRYSNDERTFEDVRYQLRFRPGNPWKIRRNNALFNARKEAISLRQSLEFKETLFERYTLMLEYLIAIQKRELSRKQLELSQRKVNLFEQSVQSDLFDARDYVDAKLETIEFLEDYDELRVEVNQAQQQIKLILVTDNVDWSEFELIAHPQIQEIMNSIITSTFDAAELAYLEQQVEVAQLETSTERADFDLGFVQAEYAPFKNNGDNELGFSFGVTIPIFRNNKDQIAERILDEIEQESEFETLAYRDSINKALESSFLTDYLEHHNQLLAEIEKLNIDVLTSNLAVSEDFDPIALLDLEEGKLRLEELVVRSNERLLQHYLDFLFAFDALQQLPLQNYLANDLSFIE